MKENIQEGSLKILDIISPKEKNLIKTLPNKYTDKDKREIAKLLVALAEVCIACDE